MKAASSIALLDTDYSKTLCVHDNGPSPLDVIRSLERYEFCCHEQILNELGNCQDTLRWVNNQIAEERITLYRESRHFMFIPQTSRIQ